MKEIPKIFKRVGYKHIPEEDIIEIYKNLSDGSKMFNITFDFDEETFDFSNIHKEEFGKYLRRKKLENIRKNVS